GPSTVPLPNNESKIKEGPTHICSCCGGLWFEYSIKEFTVEMLRNKGLPKEFIDKKGHHVE
ncbi:unnamed protein product, partial [Rotaria socialis]